MMLACLLLFAAWVNWPKDITNRQIQSSSQSEFGNAPSSEQGVTETSRTTTPSGWDGGVDELIDELERDTDALGRQVEILWVGDTVSQ